MNEPCITLYCYYYLVLVDQIANRVHQLMHIPDSIWYIRQISDTSTVLTARRFLVQILVWGFSVWSLHGPPRTYMAFLCVLRLPPTVMSH